MWVESGMTKMAVKSGDSWYSYVNRKIAMPDSEMIEVLDKVGKPTIEVFK